MNFIFPSCTLHFFINNLLYEFYFHNLRVPDDREWNPLMYVGDIYLRSLLSCIKNELSREEQERPYRGEEMTMCLLLGTRDKDPRKYYMDWVKVFYSKLQSYKIDPWREVVYEKFEKLADRKLREARRSIMKRWIKIPHDFKVNKPHSP